MLNQKKRNRKGYAKILNQWTCSMQGAVELDMGQNPDQHPAVYSMAGICGCSSLFIRPQYGKS
jgi:hypothetical protein